MLVIVELLSYEWPEYQSAGVTPPQYECTLYTQTQEFPSLADLYTEVVVDVTPGNLNRFSNRMLQGESAQFVENTYPDPVTYDDQGHPIQFTLVSTFWSSGQGACP